MQTLQLGVLIVASAVGLFAARTPWASPAPQQTAAKKQTGKDITLTGCVGGDTVEEGRFTFSDTGEGTTYRLSGTDMREYSGRRVQIVGAVGSRRLHVVGGLVPSANAAAQAGALDPARAEREGSAGTGGGVGTGQLPEFRVKRVRPLTGSCP